MIAEYDDSMCAQSRLGKEAAFTVEVPVFTELEPSKPAAPSAADSQKLAGAKILVVDDEPSLLQLLDRVLTDEGYQVETVDNGCEALERIGSQRYSLILLDIKLPGMSDIELYQHLPNIARSLVRRVFFITGDVLGPDTSDFLHHTKAPCFFKPFHLEPLRKDINRILAQRAYRQEERQ